MQSSHVAAVAAGLWLASSPARAREPAPVPPQDALAAAAGVLGAAVIDRVVPRLAGDDIEGALRVLEELEAGVPDGASGAFDALHASVRARAGHADGVLPLLLDALLTPSVGPWLLASAAEGLAADAPAWAAMLAAVARSDSPGGRQATAALARILDRYGATARAAAEVSAALGVPGDRLRGLPARVVLALPPQATAAAETERAWLLSEAPATDLARAAFAAALALPGDPETRCWALHGAGRASLRGWDLGAARAALDEARATCAGHPETGDSVVQLARTAYVAGAIDVLDAAIAWGLAEVPEWTRRHGTLALATLARAKGPAAELAGAVRKSLQRRRWLDPVGATAMRLFKRHAKRGSPARAAAVLEPLVSAGYRNWRSSTWGQADFWLADTLLRRGKATGRAVELLEGVVRRYPTSWYGLLSLARLAREAPQRAALVEQDVERDAAGLADVAPRPDWELSPAAAAVATRVTALRRWGLVGAMEIEARRGGFEQHPGRAAWLARLLADSGAASAGSRLAERALMRHGVSSPLADPYGLWAAARPRPYRAALEAACARAGVDPHFAWGVMRVESRYATTAVSHAGARGLLQLMPGTAEWLGRRAAARGGPAADLFDPPHNLRLGVDFLRRLSKRYGGSMPLTLVGYNAGPGNVRRLLRGVGTPGVARFVEELPYAEAKDYVRSVTSAWANYRLLYQDDLPRLDDRLPSHEVRRGKPAKPRARPRRSRRRQR